MGDSHKHRFSLPTRQSPTRKSPTRPDQPRASPEWTNCAPLPHTPASPQSTTPPHHFPNRQHSRQDDNAPTSFQTPQPTANTLVSQQFKRPPRFSVTNSIPRAQSARPEKDDQAAGGLVESEPVKKRPRLSARPVTPLSAQTNAANGNAPPTFKEPPSFSAFLASARSARETSATPSNSTTTPKPTSLHHPRFHLPPSTPHGLSSDAAQHNESILLPEQFSPRHKRGRERFVPGGWADEVRASLLELSATPAHDAFTPIGLGSGDVNEGFVNETLVRCVGLPCTSHHQEEHERLEKAKGLILIGFSTNSKAHPISGSESVIMADLLNFKSYKAQSIQIKSPMWDVPLDFEKEAGLDGLSAGQGKSDMWMICPNWITMPSGGRV